jgi:hypothetical protein
VTLFKSRVGNVKLGLTTGRFTVINHIIMDCVKKYNLVWRLFFFFFLLNIMET